jgi:sporulation protein YunB
VKNGRWFFLLIVLLVLMGYSIIFMERVVEPTIASIGITKATAILSLIVNEAVVEKLTEDIQSGNLLDIKTDETGKVSMVQADAAAMNRLSYALAADIQHRIKDIQEEKILVPLGSILGSAIMSQTGPKVNMKVLPLGTTKISFRTEFIEAGINQTKYKVYLEVENMAKVLVPFSSNDIKVDTVLLIAETIIVGDIPESYVIIPDQGAILDGMQQSGI